MILLDTCALLWLAHDQGRMSDETLRQINETPLLHVSAITAFEIGVKHRAGKLRLPVSPRLWLESILSHHDVSVIDLDSNICLRATELPPIHRDPCDRFIVATALIKACPVVTADKRFTAYGVATLI